MLLAMVFEFNLELEQMNVKIVFLYGDLDKIIYMKQPKEFEIEGKKDYVCKLNRSLYGQNNLQGNRSKNLMSSLLELVLNVVSMTLASTSSS